VSVTRARMALPLLGALVVTSPVVAPMADWLPAAPARLMAQETTGSIRGVVTGPDNRPLAGATVTATNTETGLVRNAIAGDDGAYVIRLLPSGTYRVTVRRLGSQQQERTGIRVSVGSSTPVNFALSEAAAQLGAVQVRASQQVDVADGGVKQAVSQEEIQNLPTLGRDFTDFINLSGLVSPTPETTTGGQFSIAGARPSQTNVQLDGVDANNTFFGENRGGSRIPFNFSIESVKEFQIITNGFDVEYGNYAGGIVNIISKGGTNRRKVTAYGNYRGDALTSENFNGTPVNNFNVQQYAFQAEGPLVKDKLFWLVSVDGQRRREPFVPNGPDALLVQAADFERRADAAATPAEASSLRASAVRARQTADSLGRFFSILNDRYGVGNPAGAYNEFATRNDVLTLFARIDWNINSKHRLSLRNNYSNYDNGNETFGGTAIGGLSQTESFKNRTNSLVGELNSTLGDRATNVFRFQYSGEERPRVGADLKPQLRVNNVIPGTAYAWGGNSLAFRNNLIENKIQIVNNTTVDLGRHTLKFGTNNIIAHYENDFWNQGSGFYTFDNLAALEAYRPLQYTRNVRSDGQVPRAVFDTYEYSAYAQDQWRVTPRLLATLGLRYDLSRFGDAPGRVIDAERAFGIETGIAPIDKNNISPRVALAWDRKGDASEVWRAGAGLFYGRLPAVLGSNVGITDVPLQNLACTGSAADGDANAPPPVNGYRDWAANGDNNPFNCAGAAGIGGIPEYSFWTQGFEIPETYRGNVGYERQLGRKTRVSADYLYAFTSNLYTVRNTNLRQPLFSLANEGNRQVYVPIGAFRPNAAAGNERLINTDLGNVFQNFYDGRARSQALTFNLDHRLAEESSLRASYTWTTADDNGSFSCCTSFAGWSDSRIGASGPNDIGGIGDTDKAWGPSGFVRNHTIILSGFTKLPLGFRLSGIFRMQSGTPWGPEQGGDLNADGLSFNDRPFIFAPEDFPVAIPTNVTGSQAQAEYVAAQREIYRGYLNDNKCVGDYVGQIIPRNTCRQPWFNRLDLSLRNRIPTRAGQNAELSIDFFNVLNGLNKNWGRYESVSAARRNLMVPVSYDPTGETIRYNLTDFFGDRTPLGGNLLLQFSMQVGIRYTF
jgi:outer membrane receptor for ferrienterochelin and colicin